MIKVPVGGGSPTILVGSYLISGPLTIDTLNLYWTTGGTTNGMISKAPLAGGDVVALAFEQGDVSAIAVDGASVYWTSEVVGTVKKLSPK